MNHRTEKILKIGPLVVFFIFIIVYALFVAKDLLLGIKIKNINIKDGAIVTEAVLPISGTARGAVNLTLNGRELTIDQKGNFDDTIALLPGYNIIQIKALDKFGYVDEKNYQLIRQ